MISLRHCNRVKAGLLLIFLIFLFQTFHLFVRTVTLTIRDTEPDAITMYEKRLEPVKKALSGYKIVGYLDDSQEKNQFYLTRYILAPITLSPDKQDVVLGNFRGYYPYHLNFEDNYLVVLKDFGNGLILFREKVP